MEIGPPSPPSAAKTARLSGTERTDLEPGRAARLTHLVLILDGLGVLLPASNGAPTIRLGVTELSWLQAQIRGEAPRFARAAEPDAETVHPLEWYLSRHRVVAIAPAARPAAPRRAMARTSTGAAGPYRIATPVAVGLSTSGFEFIDHDGGARVRLDARQLAATVSFIQPRTADEAFAAQQACSGDRSLDPAEFAALVGELAAGGLLAPLADDRAHAAEGRAQRELRRGIREVAHRARDVEQWLTERRLAEQERARRTGRTRIKVVPVNSEGHPILSLGLVMASAEAHDGGRLAETYEFLPDWSDRTVPALTGDEPPALYLFSNYIWSHAWNVVRSGEVKRKSPYSLTIHGGPNTPKYEDDVAAFFRMNPQVDIAVHGEGEATFVALLDALRGHFGDGPPDLSVLRGVPGLTFRLGNEIVRTGKRDRIADVDALPSPYRSGLFDSVGETDTEIVLMTIETNRGCPYGCTFCDWGSATLSRIRTFELARVFADLEWCARHKVRVVFLADANFGIFPRDVEIARKVVALKQQYGYPKLFESSYAKNTVKHLREIIEILAAGGVLSTGTLSLQSLDATTLAAIRRSNIRVEQYEALAAEFGSHGLPFVMELMMGLPGSTLSSYLGDLQQVVDREVRARVNPTEVLMNSPMNDPAYRQQHSIEILRPVSHDWSEDIGTRQKSLIISTATYTRDEYDLMERYRRVFLLCENYGVLRQVSRFVRQETGISEIDFYVRLGTDSDSQETAWPTIRFTFGPGCEYMIPPVSWAFFIDEIRDYLVTALHIADDAALDTVLRVQHALLPARERTFPACLSLPHDFGAWHRTMLVAKRSGAAVDWPQRVPRLREFGPARFDVDDPQSVASLGLGMSVFYDSESDWELASPVARPIRYRHSIHS